MKRFVALFTALVMCLSLCACGANKPRGTYKDNIGFSTITFKGDKVESMSMGSDEVSTGTYVIEDGKILVSYDNGNRDTFEYDEETDTLSLWGGLLIFSKVEK